MYIQKQFKPHKHSHYMDPNQTEYAPQTYNYSGGNIRDVEDKQRILKDRLLLIGQNLVETKEETERKLDEMRKDLENLKHSVQKIMNFLENISDEFSKFARKEDMEILAKQAKMFQPTEFATKKDLEKLKKS